MHEFCNPVGSVTVFWVSLKGGMTGEKKVREGEIRRADNDRYDVSCLGPRAMTAPRHNVPERTETLSDVSFLAGKGCWRSQQKSTSSKK